MKYQLISTDFDMEKLIRGEAAEFKVIAEFDRYATAVDKAKMLNLSKQQYYINPVCENKEEEQKTYNELAELTQALKEKCDKYYEKF